MRDLSSPPVYSERSIDVEELYTHVLYSILADKIALGIADEDEINVWLNEGLYSLAVKYPAHKKYSPETLMAVYSEQQKYPELMEILNNAYALLHTTLEIGVMNEYRNSLRDSLVLLEESNEKFRHTLACPVAVMANPDNKVDSELTSVVLTRDPGLFAYHVATETLPAYMALQGEKRIEKLKKKRS